MSTLFDDLPLPVPQTPAGSSSDDARPGVLADRPVLRIDAAALLEGLDLVGLLDT